MVERKPESLNIVGTYRCTARAADPVQSSPVQRTALVDLPLSGTENERVGHLQP